MASSWSAIGVSRSRNEESVFAELSEDILETGDRLALIVEADFPNLFQRQIRERGEAEAGMLKSAIMIDHQMIVPGEMKIELQSVGTQFQGSMKGGERVFGREFTLTERSATMGPDFGIRHIIRLPGVPIQSFLEAGRVSSLVSVVGPLKAALAVRHG